MNSKQALVPSYRVGAVIAFFVVQSLLWAPHAATLSYSEFNALVVSTIFARTKRNNVPSGSRERTRLAVDCEGEG